MNSALVKNLANAYALAVATADFGTPNGHLYALVAMPLGAGLDEHNLAVSVLKRGGLIAEEANLLTWAGSEDLRLRLKAAMQPQRGGTR